MNNMATQLNLPTTSLTSMSTVEMVDRFGRAIDATLEPKLDALRGKQVVFSHDEREFSPLEGWEPKGLTFDIQPITAVHEPTPVAAIDSSSVFVGDTDDGSIYSAKCGLAVSLMGRPVMHFKIGPMLFYINDDVVRSSRLDHRLAKFALYDTSTAKSMIRVRIERVLQNEISKFLTNALILVDGSLRSSVFED